MPTSLLTGVESLLAHLPPQLPSLRLILGGPAGHGQRELAQAIATACGQSLLRVDLAALPSDEEPALLQIRSAIRAALLTSSAILFDGQEDERESQRWLHRRLPEEMGSAPLVGMIASTRPSVGSEAFLRIDLPIGDVAARTRWWRLALANRAHAAGDDDLRQLGSRYQLRPSRIIAAVEQAAGLARWQRHATIDATDMHAAARAQASVDLAQFAQKRAASWQWDDIVLPMEQATQLREIYDHARFRHLVRDRWSTPHLHHAAAGLNVLFSGPSGTGKTMAAEVLACALGLDLYTIDVPNTISKYVGEMEKNIDRIFTAAYEGNVVLFFDEADAFFGKRAQVKDSHDRYANVEVSYLLQRVESHDGVVILGTNLRTNMDDAFTRRLHHVVEFPFPDPELREQLWRKHLAGTRALAGDVDPHFLARQFEVAGGSIRAIASNASFLAAAEDSPVGMRHLVHATFREFQKMGRVCDDQTFGPALAFLPGCFQRSAAS